MDAHTPICGTHGLASHKAFPGKRPAAIVVLIALRQPWPSFCCLVRFSGFASRRWSIATRAFSATVDYNTSRSTYGAGSTV